MRLKRFISQGFGCLPKDFEMDFAPEGLTLIIGNNEMGKSTLVEGLLAGLYGEPKNRKDVTLFKTAFSPWQNPDQGPRLILEITDENQEHYAIYRDFGSKTTPLQVINTLTGEECKRQFQADKKTFLVGETFTGLSRSTFEKSALQLQNQLQAFESHSELITAIEKVVNSGETGTTAQAALDRLKKAESQHFELEGKTLQLSTILSRLSNQILNLEEQQTALTEGYYTYQDAIHQRKSIEAKVQELESKLKTATFRVQITEALEAKRILDTQIKIQQELAELSDTQKSLEAFENFPIHHQKDFQAFCGQLSQVQHHLSELETEQTRLKNEVETKAATLTSFPWSVNAIDLDDIQLKIQQFETAKAQFDFTKAELQSEYQRLENRGFESQRFQELFYRFNPLPTSTMNDLCQCLQQEKALQEELSSEPFPIKEVSKQRLSGKSQSISLILIGISAFSTSFFQPKFSWIGIILGSLLVLLWIILYFKKATQEKQFQDKVNAQVNSRNAIENQRHQIHEKIQSLQEQLRNPCPEITRPETLSNLLWFNSEKQQDFAQALMLQQKLALRESDLQAVLESLEKALTESSHPSSPLLERLATIKPVIDQYHQFQALHTSHQALLKQCQEIETRKEAQQKRQDETREKMHQILAECHLPETDSSEATIDQFNQAVEAFHQLEKLKVAAAEKSQQLKTPEALDNYQRQLVALQVDPDTEKPSDLASPFEERQQLTQLKAQQESLKNEETQLQLLIKEKQDDYNRRFPKIQAELAERQTLFQKFQQFQTALSIAQETLQAVSQDEFTQWSQYLNERTNTLLEQFHSPYSQIFFKPDLQFSLFDSTLQKYHQADAFQHLSCGAKDQIYLAIRFAITDYLSQEKGHIPIILDDPFVNFDDDRFYNALETLAKVSTLGQQVILFSCHTQRYQDAFLRLKADYENGIFLHPFGLTKQLSQNVVLIGE